MNGDDLTIDMEANASGSRKCGSCTLCCRLLPVPQLHKLAGTRCKYQRHSCGCSIYPRRPDSCRDWMCRWLAEAEETKMLRRPDHAHYVVDIYPDRMRTRDKTTGVEIMLAVLVVWIDPAFPQAKDDPALREYMAYMAEPPRRMPTLVRLGSQRAIVIAPPSMSGTGDWYEDHAPERDDSMGRFSDAGGPYANAP